MNTSKTAFAQFCVEVQRRLCHGETYIRRFTFLDHPGLGSLAEDGRNAYNKQIHGKKLEQVDPQRNAAYEQTSNGNGDIDQAGKTTEEIQRALLDLTDS